MRDLGVPGQVWDFRMILISACDLSLSLMVDYKRATDFYLELAQPITELIRISLIRLGVGPTSMH